MAVVDGGRDRGALRRGATRAQVFLSAGYIRHALFTTAVVLTAVVYFPLAYYLSVSYTPDVPQRGDVAQIYEIKNTTKPGIVVTHLWLPAYVTKASVYQDGVLLGEATAVYDNPVWTFTSGDRRWKYVEFSGRIGTTNRYWVVFR